MPTLAQGTNVRLVMKAQSALGTPASGAGGTIILARPGQGLARQVATIESQILDTSGMAGLSEPGSESGNATFETEARVGALDLVYKGVLGFEAPAQDITQAALTSVAISGTGTLLTFGGGDLVALGLRAGMAITFTGLATTGNNNRRVHILSIPTPTTATITPASDGVLTDEGADSSFSMHVDKAFYTDTPRTVRYYSAEQQYTDIAASRLLTDGKFNALAFACQANQPLTNSFGLVGLKDAPVGSYPNFTGPTDPTIAGARILKMLDGGALYRNGVAAAGLTGVTMGISANSSVTPLLTSRFGLDVALQRFVFAGQFTAVLLDFAAFTAAAANTPLSALMVFKEDSSPAGQEISVYAGNLLYAQPSAPIVDGDIVQTLPLYGGFDNRGGGYARTTLLISTSAP